MNNLCEIFWANLRNNVQANEQFLQLLRSYGKKSIEDMNSIMTAIIGQGFKTLGSWKFDDVRKFTNVPVKYQNYPVLKNKDYKKIVVFCLDISGSMAGGRL